MDPYLETYLVGFVVSPFVSTAYEGFPRDNDSVMGLVFGAIAWPIFLPAVLGDMIFRWRKGRRK